MNQVTEMLRLTSVEKLDAAIERLNHLFEMMAEQPGFLHAELLKSTRNPEMLLVLHAWQSIDDWQDFRASDTKISFMGGRPSDLYSFVPCGTNWLFRWGPPDTEDARFLRREVLRGEPTEGLSATGSRLFAYQDYEQAFRGTMMRLTRLETAPDATASAQGLEVVADEVFESVLRNVPAKASRKGASV